MAKQFIVYAIPLILFFSAGAQSASKPAAAQECIPRPDVLDGMKVFRLASKLAQYPGGDQKMMQFIQDNFKHPAGKNQTRKTIVVTFVIDSCGRVRNPCIERKEGKGTDESSSREIIRVFESMPRWEPAVLNGKKSYMRIVMPVQLILD